MDCAPEWAPGRESSLRSAGWASKGSGEALHLAVGRHVRARKLPLELVWIKNHPDDGSTSVYCSTDEKCRLGKSNSWRATIRRLRVDVRKDWRDLNDDDQSRLLGLRKDSWALLGRMRGSAKETVFDRYGEKIQKAIRRVVIANDADFPDVAIEAYASLVDPNVKGIGKGIASRLLALAKPDRFVSLNGGSSKGLAKYFGPDTPTALGVPKNYRSLLEEIYDRNWFREPAPQNAREQEIASMRAALLDCFVYEDTGI